MAIVTCDACSGMGGLYLPGQHTRSTCTSCDGKGKYEDGRFEPTDLACTVGFFAGVVLAAAAGAQLLIWAKPVFRWLSSLGWYSVPTIAAAVLALCVIAEFARWALTLKARRLAVVKRKINQA